MAVCPGLTYRLPLSLCTRIDQHNLHTPQMILPLKSCGPENVRNVFGKFFPGTNSFLPTLEQLFNS